MTNAFTVAKSQCGKELVASKRQQVRSFVASSVRGKPCDEIEFGALLLVDTRVFRDFGFGL